MLTELEIEVEGLVETLVEGEVLGEVDTDVLGLLDTEVLTELETEELTEGLELIDELAELDGEVETILLPHQRPAAVTTCLIFPLASLIHNPPPVATYSLLCAILLVD